MSLYHSSVRREDRSGEKREARVEGRKEKELGSRTAEPRRETTLCNAGAHPPHGEALPLSQMQKLSLRAWGHLPKSPESESGSASMRTHGHRPCPSRSQTGKYSGSISQNVTPGFQPPRYQPFPLSSRKLPKGWRLVGLNSKPVKPMTSPASPANHRRQAWGALQRGS